jgi:NAD-dependent dihydropyrimidine dehydrogenase PreA subunit/flavodoxin
MKKAIIYLFSGTGNTKKIANLFKDEFKKENCETEIYPISNDNNTAPNPNNYDLVGFAYPIHAFNTPEIMVKFIKTLPEANNIPVFIIKTSGEPLHLNDGSSQKIIRILLNKGYKVNIERHIVMPYNMIFRHSNALVKQLWIYAKALTELYAKDILSGNKYNIKVSILKRLHIQFFRIEWKFANFNGKLFKVDKDKCTNCNKCINMCPVNNITRENGEIKFGNNCILCVRCSFNCPTNAINIGILNNWKVNGEYKLNDISEDDTLDYPFINDSTKGLYRIYKSYFRKADKKLKNAQK